MSVLPIPFFEEPSKEIYIGTRRRQDTATDSGEPPRTRLRTGNAPRNDTVYDAPMGQRKKKSAKDTVPRRIRLMEKEGEFNYLGALRKSAVPEFSWGPLLEIPVIRRIVARALVQKHPKGKNGVRPRIQEVSYAQEDVSERRRFYPTVEEVTDSETDAKVKPLKEVGEVRNSYTFGVLKSALDPKAPKYRVNKILIDGGAVVNLIPEILAREMNLPMQIASGVLITTATSQVHRINYFVTVDLEIAGVSAKIHCFCIPGEKRLSYEVLLSRQWLKQCRAIGKYEEGTYAIYDQNGKKHELPATPVDPNAVRREVPQVNLNGEFRPKDVSKEAESSDEEVRRMVRRVLTEMIDLSEDANEISSNRDDSSDTYSDTTEELVRSFNTMILGKDQDATEDKTQNKKRVTIETFACEELGNWIETPVKPKRMMIASEMTIVNQVMNEEMKETDEHIHFEEQESSDELQQHDERAVIYTREVNNCKIDELEISTRHSFDEEYNKDTVLYEKPETYVNEENDAISDEDATTDKFDENDEKTDEDKMRYENEVKEWELTLDDVPVVDAATQFTDDESYVECEEAPLSNKSPPLLKKGGVVSMTLEGEVLYSDSRTPLLQIKEIELTVEPLTAAVLYTDSGPPLIPNEEEKVFGE
ncbi:hypothetical protein RUND412_006364 [Rhizina undulata]